MVPCASQAQRKTTVAICSLHNHQLYFKELIAIKPLRSRFSALDEKRRNSKLSQSLVVINPRNCRIATPAIPFIRPKFVFQSSPTKTQK
jgi:hypothetical protein